MLKFLFLVLSCFFSLSCLGKELDGTFFLKKYPHLIYQDVLADREVIAEGSDRCLERYALIKPVLDTLKTGFSVLDLGAAQGYFSFSIAEDFPESSCVMIESNNTSYYSNHGDMLFDLCLLNRHLPNLFYLEKRVNLSDLSFMNEQVHYDVILAFLVVHLMEESLQDQIKIIESLLTLGDHLILEVANDVGVIHTSYVEFLGQKLDCQYLGEVKRHKDPKSTSTGKIFWFKAKNSFLQDDEQKPAMTPEVFQRLNGVYPTNYP